MPSDTTRQILDAAETLFAAQGIDAVSLRAVTSSAGAHLAAVHSHFRSQAALGGGRCCGCVPRPRSSWRAGPAPAVWRLCSYLGAGA